VRGDEERKRKEQGLEIDQETEHAMARWLSLELQTQWLLQSFAQKMFGEFAGHRRQVCRLLHCTYQ
jgi:hypothetical protein